VDGADIVADSITAGQIAAGAISVSELAANAVTAGAIAAGSIDTTKLNVGAGLGGNLCPNGSFQNGVPTQIYGYGYTAVTQITNDGLSDAKCLDISVTGPSVEGRYGWAEGPLVGGRTVTVSLWRRNPAAGSPTVVAYLLCRRAGTAVGGWDYAYIGNQGPGADGGPWLQVTPDPITLPSDVVAGFVAVGIISNGGVGGGYVSHLRFEDIQIEYGSAATAYKPSMVGSNVVIDSSGIQVINGKLTVTNPGSVVIIDGTSDMFRIVATGTLACAAPGAGAQTSAGATLSTGLTYGPASSWYVGTGSGDIPCPYYIWNLSGGAINWSYEGRANVINTNQTSVGAYQSRMSGAGADYVYTYRYYVLSQVAI
jgi:hypothetical protein